MKVEVTIRDGRLGRDPTQVSDDRHGPVLQTMLVNAPGIDVDQILTLEDGTKVKVIGVDEHLSGASWTQTVHVGNAFEIDGT